MKILSIEKRVPIFESSLTLELSGNSTSEYHWVYLRDNCPCNQCFYGETLQRTVDTFNKLPWSIDLDTLSIGEAEGAIFEISGCDLHITWDDGHKSDFTEKWLVEHSYNPACPLKPAPVVLPPKVHWDSSLFQELRGSGKLFNTSYVDLKRNLRDVMFEVYQYGFSFIKDVPVTLDATEHVSRLISIIRPTHYDEGVWDITSDLSKMDTAYTDLAIGMHTDGNYWHETPGLQMFHLLEHSGGEGGKTRIVDIASVLDKLRSLAVENESWNLTLKVLTEHNIAFHQSGEDSAIFYQEGFPTLVLDKQGQLEQCRWNTSDRCPQIPRSVQKHSKYTVPQVYEALYRFNHLINDPSNAVCFSLTPGTILIFDNWRVLHARTSFTGKRILCGSYLTRDDFLARLKSLMFTRDEIANGIYS